MNLALSVVAGIALAWVFLPAVGFALGLKRLRKDIRRDPASAEPRPGDADHERRFRQFEALGFRPVGTTYETCWFMSPLKPYWHARDRSRWMEAPDGRMFVSFHRLIDDEPVRFGVVTLFDDGGLVRTTCPGAGVTRETEDALRVELQGVEPAELVERHEVHLAAFAAAGVGKTRRDVKATTFEEIAAAETVKDQRNMRRAQPEAYVLIAQYFVLPALLGRSLFSSRGDSTWHRAAVGVCAGALVFAFVRLVVMPRQRRRRVVATRSPAFARDRNMKARLAAAKQLVRDGRRDEATEELVWLWHNMARVEPGMRGVRVSFMAGRMETLAGTYPPAMRRFAELRDEAGAAADAQPRAGAPRLDWIVLNKVVGAEARSLAWFDGVKDDAAAAPVLAYVAFVLREPLKVAGRWADLGRLSKDPLAELAFHHRTTRTAMNPVMKKRLGNEAFARSEQVFANLFRSNAADLLRSLRAAAREQEATAVRTEALRLDPSDEMKAALDAHS